MAILNASDAAQTPRPPLKSSCKPALFVRTLIPKGAVHRSISCSMLPPHALLHNPHLQPPSFQSARQLVVATDTTLQLHAVDDYTMSLTALTDLMLFTRIYDIAAVSSPVPGRDVLVVLTDASNISFMQYDEHTSRLRCSGAVGVIPPAPFPSEANIRRQARLLATHPRKRMVAVASLQSVISVFPVLFLPKHVNAGKIATVAVDGVILSLDFLEDEEGVPGDAILVALLQKGKEQVIALYRVGVPDIGGGLSVTFVGSMITCASHPDDVAVARATSKLTGESMRPTPPAVAVTRLSGCPFLFAVFVRGRIIAGDARSVIVKAHSGESLPMSVRIEHDIILPSPVSQQRVAGDAPTYEDASASHGASFVPETSGSTLLTPSSSGVGFDAQDGFVTPTQTPTNRAYGDPPAVTMPSRRMRRGGRDDIPPLPSHSRRISTSRSPYTGQGERNIGEDYLSYLFVPAYISLDVGEGNGVATAWVDARDHFSDEDGDGNGLYFVMESGAMFALRWSDNVREGATTFRIPGGERTRTTPRRNFSVEFIGDVGPARSIASLDRRLIYIANDCADGSLRQLHMPQRACKQQTRSSPISPVNSRSFRAEGLRYGLEVRQEFLNLSPISDFFLKPSEQVRDESSISLNRNRANATHSNYVKGVPKATTDTEVLLTLHRESYRKQSAFEHVIYGGSREAEIIACSGMGQYGSVRLIRPGAPVSLLASSDCVFTACNGMWPLRFSRNSNHDAGLVLTFAQATAMLLAVPPSIGQQDREAQGDKQLLVAKLIEGTKAVGLISERRTLAVNNVEDGVIAQIHEQGVRLTFLEKEKTLELSECMTDDVLMERLYQWVQDWSLPEGGIISTGAVGFGYVIVSVVSKIRHKPVLYLLKCNLSSQRSGLHVVSSVELEHEVSCIEIPNWPAPLHERNSFPQRVPSVFIIGTHEPSLEVRALDASLEVLDRRITSPWSLAMREERSFDKNRRSLSKDQMDIRKRRGKTTENKPRSLRLEESGAKSDYMTAVPESICARRIDGQQKVFAGLRDGSIMCMSVLERYESHETDTERQSFRPIARLSLDAHRKLGYRPVSLQSVIASIGLVILAQAERSWMGTNSGRGKIEWTPLAFTETRSMCSFSVQGADRCFAAVASDDSLYICALRRNISVSVRSFHVGATPRRVLAIASPQDCIVVATCSDPRSTKQAIARGARDTDSSLAAETGVQGTVWHSEIRVYDRKHRTQMGSVTLLPGELVHVLVDWLGFLLIGTSWGIQEACAQRRCKRGRLLMYSMRNANAQKASASSLRPRVKFSLCSEVVLPGAVLAGAPHPSADIFVASCNEEVIVFTVPKSRTALVEIARISARTLVVSISLKDDIVCVVDRKDSVSFFQLHSNSGRLVRDRSDHRRRIVSDAVQIDRTLAIAVDRLGGLFSIGYEDGDTPTELPVVWPDGSVMSPYLRNSPDPTISDYNPSTIDASEAQPVMSVSTLGEEFDVMQQDSSSDQTAESHDEHATAMSGEATNATSPEVSEQDHVMVSDDTGNSAVLTDGNGGSEDSNEAADEQGGETDEANPAQSADDGMMVAVQDDGNGAGAGGIIEPESAEARLDARHVGMPRNLVCHHSYNLNDIALRVRIGEFVRYEGMLEIGEFGREAGRASTAPDEHFLCTPSSAILCGTLGGAIVTAVPMSVDTYELLSEVEREMGDNINIVGPALGSSHKKYRSAFGTEAVSCVDGDLLKLFSRLDNVTKREIAALVGCSGEQGVVRIEGMIDELFDRVG